MSDLEINVRHAVDNCNDHISLYRRDITNGILPAICEIWMNCKTITAVNLSNNEITSLNGVIFPPCVEKIYMNHNSIVTLNGFVAPNDLKILQLVYILAVSELTIYVAYSKIKLLH